ncbi:MAG: hypothetical protein CMJ58_19345 [Planctomycetaceae bacterium]|nr:hypothetical protein [Planctomycetaceae bacterium]
MRVVARALALAALIIGAPSRPARADEVPTLQPPAAEAGDISAEFQSEQFLGDLNKPVGLAFRIGVGETVAPELYFAEAAAGRVSRVRLGAGQQPAPFIEGFPTRASKSLNGAEIGPLGLAFITRTKLAVGEAGAGPGVDLVRVYSLGEGPASLRYDQTDHVVGPVKPTRQPAQGGFYALALLADNALVVSSLEAGETADGGQPVPGGPWLLKATVNANKAADLQRLASSSSPGPPGPFAGVTFHSDPNLPYVVASAPGVADESPDSALAWFSLQSGRVAMALPSGLRDVMAVAYSQSGQLYVADASWADPAAGGVYRIDAAMVDGLQACRPVKIAAVPCPAALAFGPDGKLYVSSWGDPDDDASGQVVRITGKF